MIIKNAEFVMSNTSYKKCPEPNKAEFAFIGRSNVGKSSLINMLLSKNNLAKTSSTPGKTQLINHFEVNNQWYLVDLPGYGYARTSKTNKEAWQKMISSYIRNRENLISLFVLIDSRLSPQKIDIEFIRFLGENSIPFSVIFTKTDKQTSNKTEKNIALFNAEMKKEWEELPPFFVSSSINKAGREEILKEIERLIPYFQLQKEEEK
ncbi:MAG: ribosome biogenesis GTP-binding protein YihA/YsxC [Bacteroidales bacterium]|jgi:GTP-binding protein|nr:ribosome biogenesis GTP-binding protein YihA/YsxC [Bacteroidales bacterium]